MPDDFDESSTLESEQKPPLRVACLLPKAIASKKRILQLSGFHRCTYARIIHLLHADEVSCRFVKRYSAEMVHISVQYRFDIAQAVR